MIQWNPVFLETLWYVTWFWWSHLVGKDTKILLEKLNREKREVGLIWDCAWVIPPLHHSIPVMLGTTRIRRGETLEPACGAPARERHLEWDPDTLPCEAVLHLGPNCLADRPSLCLHSHWPSRGSETTPALSHVVPSCPDLSSRPEIPST